MTAYSTGPHRLGRETHCVEAWGVVSGLRALLRMAGRVGAAHRAGAGGRR